MEPPEVIEALRPLEIQHRAMERIIQALKRYVAVSSALPEMENAAQKCEAELAKRKAAVEELLCNAQARHDDALASLQREYDKKSAALEEEFQKRSVAQKLMINELDGEIQQWQVRVELVRAESKAEIEAVQKEQQQAMELLVSLKKNIQEKQLELKKVEQAFAKFSSLAQKVAS